MKIRGDINAVGEGADGSRALLAAFLEATGKIDRRALQKRGAPGDAPIAVNLEALPPPLEANPNLLEADLTLVEATLAALDAAPPLLEASPRLVEANPTLLEAGPTTASKSVVPPYIFRRANVVKP